MEQPGHSTQRHHQSGNRGDKLLPTKALAATAQTNGISEYGDNRQRRTGDDQDERENS